MSTAVTFIAGATAALSAVAGLYFFRFWRLSRDRFFLVFAAAFAVFSANRIALSVVAAENDAWIFACRLIAFLLIAAAIVEKNRAR